MYYVEEALGYKDHEEVYTIWQAELKIEICDEARLETKNTIS